PGVGASPPEAAPACPSAARGSRPRKMTVAQADEGARELARRLKRAFFLLSVNEQARRIGCHFATWKKAPYFLEAQKIKARLLGEAAGRKGARSPRVTSL